MTKDRASCAGEPAAQFAERYVQGTLTELESERFEEHYFDCEACFAHVQTLQSIVEVLERERQPEMEARPRGKGALIAWPRAMMVTVGIAAMVLVAFIGYRIFTRVPREPVISQSPATQQVPVIPSVQQGPAATDVTALADLTLPAFSSSTLRGGQEDVHFVNGMKAYQRGQCGAVLHELSRVAHDAEEAASAQFYSGVCQMHEGDLLGSTQALRKIANAGDSPQQEAALYYLAQIALAHGDSASGQRYLESTIKLHGDFEQRARAELKRVNNGTGSK